jgi:hypothetical protein
VVRNDQHRRRSGVPSSLPGNSTQGLTVQMVEMGVRHQNHIHGRQIVQAHSGLAKTFQHEQPACKIGVEDNVLPAHLQKEARMSNERKTHFAVADQLRFVGPSRTPRDNGVPNEAGKLLCPFAQRRILQRGLNHEFKLNLPARKEYSVPTLSSTLYRCIKTEICR